MTIGRVCNRRIAMADRTASILDAAKSMEAFGERVLVVTDRNADGSLQAVGVVTDREITAFVARGGDPRRDSLQDIMRTGIGFVTEADDLFETVRWMHQNQLREAIVHCENGALAGIVTLDQLCGAIAGDISADVVCAPEGNAGGDRARLH